MKLPSDVSALYQQLDVQWTPLSTCTRYTNPFHKLQIMLSSFGTYLIEHDEITLNDCQKAMFEDDNFNLIFTAFHELGHWTGASTRLNRFMPYSHEVCRCITEETTADLFADFMMRLSGRRLPSDYLRQRFEFMVGQFAMHEFKTLIGTHSPLAYKMFDEAQKQAYSAIKYVYPSAAAVYNAYPKFT